MELIQRIKRFTQCLRTESCIDQNSEYRYKIDFGQYASLWEQHKENYKYIIRITKDYLVYIDKKNNIDWETKDEYDNSRQQRDNHAHEKALSQCSIAERKPINGLDNISTISFKTIIGEAIVNCIEENYAGSAELLAEAEKFRIDRVIEKSREWYLSYTVILSSILVLIDIAINSFATQNSAEVIQQINCGTWAIAGACLSIILRSGRLKNASYAGKRLHLIESGCRLIGGFISGQVAFLGIKSGVLFANLVSTGHNQYIFTLLALLAGASERFAPSIITKIDNLSSAAENQNGESNGFA